MNPQKDAGIQIQGEIFLSQTENVDLNKNTRSVFLRTRNSLPISSHLPTVHIVTTAHHMEWGMETKWLYGLFSNILKFSLYSSSWFIMNPHLSA